MLTKVPHNVNTICVHTGNILNLNELKIKAGQNPTDELIESLKITLSSWQPKNDGVGQHLQIRRTEGSPMSQLENEDRSGLKVSVKVFISSLKKEALHESLDSMFSTLDMEYIDSLVLAYPSKSESSLLLAALKELWQILEDYVERKKIHSIGVSDVDTEVFIALYDWAKIKPSIIQINLATCCVVPPALQEFTKANDVQLLTHSDPFGNFDEEREILPRSALTEVFGSEEVTLFWALRFQVHLKCRGVLASKGYVLCVHRSQ